MSSAKRRKLADGDENEEGQSEMETHSLTAYEASMVLSAVGDAIGFKGGSWEFNKNGAQIHKEAEKLGGVAALEVGPGWPVSDDTVMHLATARALANWNGKSDLKRLYEEICAQYVECWKDMNGRAPGIQCANAMPTLKKGKWDKLEYSNAGGGCGASMRAMCIGLVFWREEQQDDLIAVSTESGRMTHNHPTGFLGAVVAALFTAYAIRQVPVAQWGRKFLNEAYPKCLVYLEKEKRFWSDYQKEPSRLGYFKDKWSEYLVARQIAKEGADTAVFPTPYGIDEREAFYRSISWSGWGGSSGHDSVIIAYDALLGCGGDWIEFLKRGALHGGDSDSTGAIGAAWFGIIYQYKGVPAGHIKDLEYLAELKSCATSLFELSNTLQKPLTTKL